MAICATGWLCLDRRLDERRLGGLDHLVVALPAFVLQLQVLDRDRVGVGVEVWQGLELGDPAAIDLVGDRGWPASL